MARTRRRQPFDPSKPAHDRRSTDKLKDAQLAPQEVDDPFEAGSKIIVMRSIRNDPLASLHARNHIDDAQYAGGRAFQRDFEDAGQGARAIDYEAPAVDCSRVDRATSPKIANALDGLAKAFKGLGQNGSAITISVLIHGMTIAQLGAARGATSEPELKYLGARFRECLDCLALVYGFATK